VEVTPVNDIATTTLPAPQIATEDTVLTINGISVQDPDSATLTTTLTLPANAGVINVVTGGGAIITNNGTNTVVISGTSVEINAALAAVEYTPAADFNTAVSGPIAIVVDVNDGIGTDTSSLALTVLPVVDISDDTVVTNEEQDITFDVLANDNFEGVATVSLFTQAQHGTVVLNPNGTFSYSPNANFNGTDSFTYTASVGGITETATVNITVLPENDNPVATDDSYSVDGATGATGVVLNLLDNDTDVDDDTLVVSSIAGQLVIAGQTQTLPVPNGEVTISASGVITFYPDPSFVGDFNFDYEISDGEGGTASATVYIDITPAPRVEGEYRHYGTFRPDFTVPLRPVDPALHVLLSVQQARNEIQLSAGLNLLDVDSVAYKELLGGLDIGLAFASGDNGLGELGGKDFSPLGIDSYPDNALYVQQSVRQIPLPTSHAVFVQLAVNQSQLESAARNGLVDSFNSASLGVNHLLDPFAKPELSATKIVANNDRLQISDDVNNTLQKLTDKQAPSSLIADHTAFVEHVDVGGEEITAANSFSEQLRQSAALRLASGSENLIIHHKKA
ncbi:MAG: tandem-95 repeat protein, partial [Pseudomonadales bacterium]|nr:tandem-95 repeat protein [Pseudomonadales bacterium]